MCVSTRLVKTSRRRGGGTGVSYSLGFIKYILILFLKPVLRDFSERPVTTGVTVSIALAAIM